ncbi:MAG TPA: hypothetical protein DCP31_04560 [Cyanobacteria bacterium UBA8543]|nr:hypothetical protein [Cyanobacteria bacterium UBA8543]
MLLAIAIKEHLISVTQIKTVKTMRTGRIAGTFERERQLNHEHETGGCRRRGGRRFGAGRKRGCGKWGEETVVMRIPKSQVELIKAFLDNIKPIEMI